MEVGMKSEPVSIEGSAEPSGPEPVRWPALDVFGRQPLSPAPRPANTNSPINLLADGATFFGTKNWTEERTSPLQPPLHFPLQIPLQVLLPQLLGYFVLSRAGDRIRTGDVQ